MTNQFDNENETTMFNEQENNALEAEVIEEIATTQSTQQEDSCKEQLLRISADFNNYKRRVEKERTEWMLTSQGAILEKILGIFDELDRALLLSEEKNEQDAASLLTGFKLIQKNWHKLFTELGIEEISTAGNFDPMVHEGLVQVEDATKESGSIAQTFSKGYRFKGKVLRHAKVSVVK